MNIIILTLIIDYLKINICLYLTIEIKQYRIIEHFKIQFAIFMFLISMYSNSKGYINQHILILWCECKSQVFQSKGYHHW